MQYINDYLLVTWPKETHSTSNVNELWTSLRRKTGESCELSLVMRYARQHMQFVSNSIYKTPQTNQRTNRQTNKRNKRTCLLLPKIGNGTF